MYYTAKASQQSDIPTKIFLKNQTILQNLFTEVSTSVFQNQCLDLDLELVDVTTVYKEKSKNSKDNDKSVSRLSNISEYYEKCVYDQIQLFFDSLLSKYQCGFREGYNA